MFREFKGVVTQADRTAIPEDCFYRLDNLQPIGHANIHTVPYHSVVGSSAIVGTPYWQQYATLLGNDYCYVFCTNGNIWQVNIAVGVNSYTLINPATPLSGSGSRMDQWNSGTVSSAQTILFSDSTGIYTWDGATFAKLAASAPQSGTEIAVYAGRLWVFQNRLIIVSAAGDFSAATGWGAASTIVYLTDPQLRGPVTRAVSASGYLYIFGKSSINVISDVYVPTGSTAPVFTNTNIQALIGTDQPSSVFVVDRNVYFANQYGAHILQGVTVERLSKDIDGTWQYLDFTVPIFGGVALVNNILCAGFLVKQKNDPFFGTRLAIWIVMDKKWWCAVPFYFPTAATMCWGMSGGRPALITASAASGLNDVFGYPAYNASAPNVAAPASAFATALWSMGDPLSNKEVIEAGIELTNIIGNQALSYSLKLDTQLASTAFTSSGSIGFVSWINNALQTVSWINNALQTVLWFNGTYALLVGDSLGGYAHYVGISGSAPVNAVYQLNMVAMDYELRQRWT
jgi:hypothetical protein